MAAALLFWGEISSAQEINTIFPAAVRAGITNLIKITGSDLDHAVEAWTPFSSFFSLEKSSDSKAIIISLACPANTPVGIYPFHLTGGKGVSKWFLMMVDDLITEPASENSNTPPDAQPVVFPTAVEGIINPDESRFFRWEGKTGARYRIEAVAHRLGSLLDPVLQILDGEGRTLAKIYDEPGIGADCRLSFSAPADGSYFIKLHDTAFAGGNNYKFRLRLGGIPLAVMSYPLTTQPSSETLEMEPNNNEKEALSVELPLRINGSFDQGSDVDCFKFQLAAGERVYANTRTRSLGSQCDLFLQLWNGGKMVAESNPSSPNEAELTHQAKDSGDYILQVKEISGQFGELFRYHAEITKKSGNFQLSCDKDVIQISPGKSSTVKITAARSGEARDIKLSLEGLGEGVTVENAVIPKDKNEVELKISIQPDWRPGQMLHFRIVAAESEGNGAFNQYVSTGPALKKTFPLILYPPAGMDGLFTLAIVSE